jgi:hypothetical protein
MNNKTLPFSKLPESIMIIQNTKSIWYVGRSVGFNQDKTYANLFEVSYEDSKPTLQLKLIETHCRDELWSKFRANFLKRLPTDRYLNLHQKAAI